MGPSCEGLRPCLCDCWSGALAEAGAGFGCCPIQPAAQILRKETHRLFAGFARCGVAPSAMKSIVHLQTRRALIFVWMFILSGCNLPPPSTLPFSCSSFTESFWEEFGFGIDSPDDVVSTVARLWGIERADVQVDLTAGGDEVLRVRWRSIATIGPLGEYLASFQDDQKLAKISVKWGNPRPTLAETIECLGLPDHYIAFYDFSAEAQYLELAALYTEKRVIIRHDDQFWSAELSEIHPGMRMDRFIVVAHGPVEQIVTDMYSHGFEVRYHARSVCLLKSWPGSIAAMEIASHEERIQCGVFPQ